MATAKTYNANEVVIIFGTLILGGFADGDFVQVDRESDDWSTSAGIDGEVTRSKMNDPRVTITVTMTQASSTNKRLSDLRNADNDNGNGLQTLTIKDLRGDTELFCESAWISKPPDISFGRESGTTEWVFSGVETKRTDGGL